MVGLLDWLRGRLSGRSGGAPTAPLTPQSAGKPPRGRLLNWLHGVLLGRGREAVPAEPAFVHRGKDPLAFTPIMRFLDGEPHYVSSSNVRFFQYHKENEELIVGYLNGSQYAYAMVGQAEAISAFHAPSAGKWVWSFLRVRGSKTAHRKPYIREG